MAELLFERAGEALVRLPIDRDRVRLGSGPENDIVLPVAAVAREQAVLELRRDGWFLTDASGRGTLVDGNLVEGEVPIGDGTVLGLGSEWTARFSAGTPSTPGETRQASVTGGDTVALRRTGAPRRILRIRWRSGGRDQVLRLGEQTISIGTDEGNSVVVEDDYASAFHARIARGQEGWVLEDLDSTNGTHIQGMKVREAEIGSPVTVLVGETELFIEEDRKDEDEDAPPHGIVTADPGLLEVLSQVDRVGNSDATVTVFGESGTGKELVARAIHDASPRWKNAYIPVNCAAISKELVESELFGHEKGAFTGAVVARKGAFEEADGGTLFLDEIGELALDLQAKLLRAIELKEIRRVGSSKTMIVDVRIVTATNRDLQAEVRAGNFREDLFYRLFVVPLTLPPLRRRKGDVTLLCDHFLRSRSLREAPPSLTDAAREKLEKHQWPGNVRELKNALERALLLHRGDQIDADDITFAEPISVAPEDGVIYAVGKTIEEITNEAIVIGLKANNGNRRMTAKALGMARSTLQVRIKELGIGAGSGEDDEPE